MIPNKNLGKIGFVLYAVVVLGCILHSNPTLLTSSLLRDQFRALQDNPANASAKIWSPIRFANPTVETKVENPIYYRQSLDRRAVFKVPSVDFEVTPLWTTALINRGIHGASKASVVADQEHVFVGGDDSWFHCFDHSGKELWKFYLGDSGRGIHSTAMIDGDSVYVGSYRGSLYRLRKATGQLIWMRIVGDTIGASPLIDGDFILTAVETTKPNGYILKINKNSGEIVWRSPNLGEQSHSSPSLDKSLNMVVLGVNNKTLQGFDYQTGERRWKTRISGEVKSTVLIDDQHRGFVTSWGKEVISFKILTGEILWKAPLKDKSQVSPVLFNQKHVLLAADLTGFTVGIDSETGTLKFAQQLAIQRQVSSPILLTDGHTEKALYVCKTRTLCLINGTGAVEKTWPVAGHYTGSPYVINDTVYLSFDEGGLQALHLVFRHR